MKITSIHIRPIIDGGKLLAVASVTLDNEMIIRNIKVIDTGEKRFIRMPYNVSQKGVRVDVVHPINQNTRRYLEDALLTAYDEAATQIDGENLAGWIKTVV